MEPVEQEAMLREDAKQPSRCGKCSYFEECPAEPMVGICTYSLDLRSVNWNDLVWHTRWDDCDV